MLATLRSIAALLLSYGLLLMANGLFATLLGVRTSIEGFSTEVVGIVMAGYFLGLLTGGRHAVRVVASVGHIRAFAAFASIMSASALVHVLWIDPFAWFFLRFIAGFCMAGMIMVSESWINERATNQMRGRVLSFYMITNYFGSGCGQFVLPLGDPGKFHLFSVASIIFSLALVPVLLTRAQAPRPTTTARMKIKELYAISPLGIVGVFCAGLVNSAFYAMGPLFAKGIGLSTHQISVFMASAIFGGLLLQWPVGRLSDRLDRRWVLAGVALLTSVACLLIVNFSHAGSPTPLYAATAAYGAFVFTVYSLSAAHINDFADRGKLIQVAAGLLIVYGIGASIGPIIAAFSMGKLGPAGAFLYSTTIMALLGGFALYRMSRRASKTKDERAPFVAIPSTQFMSDKLYAAARKQMDRDLAATRADLAGARRAAEVREDAE